MQETTSAEQFYMDRVHASCKHLGLKILGPKYSSLHIVCALFTSPVAEDFWLKGQRE